MHDLLVFVDIFMPLALTVIMELRLSGFCEAASDKVDLNVVGSDVYSFSVLRISRSSSASRIL